MIACPKGDFTLKTETDLLAFDCHNQQVLADSSCSLGVEMVDDAGTQSRCPVS